MKKGISPLIASVLLIAFAIILFGLITVWVRRAAIEPSMQASEEKIASELECNEKMIKIISACKDTNNIKVVIDNLGTRDLYGVKIRVVGDTGTALGDHPNLNIVPLGRSSLLTVPITGTGTITNVEVYPMTTKGICQGQLVTTDNILTSC